MANVISLADRRPNEIADTLRVLLEQAEAGEIDEIAIIAVCGDEIETSWHCDSALHLIAITTLLQHEALNGGGD